MATRDSSLRVEAMQILRFQADGGPLRESLLRAQQFAEKNQRVAMAWILKGDVYKRAGDRSSAIGAPIHSVRPYYDIAEEAYQRAAMLAPMCVTTAVAHANLLAACHRYADAEKAFRRAASASIHNIVDPADNHLEPDYERFTPDERKQAALVKAKLEEETFKINVTKQIHSRVDQILLTYQGIFPREARTDVDALAAQFPFSSRALLMPAFLYREFVHNLSRSIPKEKFFEKLLRETTPLADEFDNSCMIALFRAEVLFMLNQHSEARKECMRGLSITKPIDPFEDDLPPGNFTGESSDARVCAIREQLSMLLDAIAQEAAEEEVLNPKNTSPGVAVIVTDDLEDDKELFENSETDATDLITAEELNELQCKMEKLPLDLEQDKVKDRGFSQAKKHGIPRLFMKPRTMREPFEAPRAEQVFGDMIVPVELVKQYALYCQEQSTCSKYKEVCHMCVFDSLAYYNNKFKKSFIEWHCRKVHRAAGMECEFKDCFVRFKTEDEKALHTTVMNYQKAGGRHGSVWLSKASALSLSCVY